MEFYKTDDGQIQADLARRLGIVLKQYQNEISSEEKYEVSLCLAILQTLLTNCIELLNTLKDSEKKLNPFYQSPIDQTIWGFDETNVKYNSFKPSNLTAEKIVRHIRNALSHPTKIDLSHPAIRTTGYISSGMTNEIETVIFISSPDINGRRRSKTFKTLEAASDFIIRDGSFPEQVQVTNISDQEYAITLGGSPFHRVFEIELSSQGLFTLTSALSKYLSHPLIEKWDGETFAMRKQVA